MSSQVPQHQPPPYTKTPARREQDEWEDWEDDDGVTPIDAGEQILIHGPQPPLPARRVSVRAPVVVVPRSRVSVVKIKRKSHHRQKAQNEKAGITLVTDMNAFRRPKNAAHQLRAPDGRPVKFVDAAALRALEGEPNSASVGNWNWFKKSKTHSPATPSPLQPARSPDQLISPDDRPIIIGISLPSDEYAGSSISPPSATPRDLQTPIEPRPTLQIPSTSLMQPSQPAEPLHASPTPTVQKSFWSPDTPDTAISWGSSRVTSSIYSQLPPPGVGPSGSVPPVPAVPENFKPKSQHQKLLKLEVGNGKEEEDIDTPCTLFEEDDVSSPKKSKGKKSLLTPDSAGSTSHGWWDHHVVTPFMDKRLTFTRKAKLESPKEEEEWWSKPVPEQTKPQYLTPNPLPQPSHAPIVRAPIVREPLPPRRTPSNRSDTTAVAESGPSTARSSPTLQGSPMREKAEAIVTPKIIIEQPPPYSPPKKKEDPNPLVRYRAVFPPGHPLQAQFPPSPGPVSPGLAATMTSQGGTQMTDIPLTPASSVPTRSPLSQIALPIRPVGTFLPQEHSHEEFGDMTRVERERRRHEKEEVLARKMGGFWRGRGCMPKDGCFGRTGREGRKRRRVCLFCLIVILILIILAIVLGVVLTRPHKHHEQPSIWVNLTDYPPMPTGILSVVGPDNTVSRSGCTEPSTLWSCSLPKEQHDSVAPYKPNQPTIVLNIQYDNNTRETWKVPNGDAPPPVTRRSVGGAAGANGVIRERQTSDFSPDPSPPDYQEMWFLGNYTDDIKADEKAGEPTPFYISLLNSSHATETTKLEKRQNVSVSIPSILPSPDLNQDGTPKPAVMIPEPVQQPVRLYDRGLPTEHYGFYTYFKRTIYLKSVTVLNETDSDVPLDEDGGCAETEAKFLTTWSETRLLVQIWTQSLNSNTSKLLTSAGQGTINGTKELIRPGTMPWPVTVTLDTHGGDPAKKFVWDWSIDNRQQLNMDDPKLLVNDMSFAGSWINKRSRGDKKFGGFDGGTGGCKCEWVNWV